MISKITSGLFIALFLIDATKSSEVCIQPTTEKACFSVTSAANDDNNTEVAVVQVQEEGCFCKSDEIEQINKQIATLKNQIRLSASNPHELFCPLGMKSGAIQDSQLTDSSHRHHYKKPSLWSSSADARLDQIHTKDRFGGWHPASNAGGYFKQWIQVDLLEATNVTGIVTQGRALGDKYDQWAASYKIHYGDDVENLRPILNENGDHMIFPGNFDRDTKKMNFFPVPITARYVRVMVWSFHRVPVLRVELLGC